MLLFVVFVIFWSFYFHFILFDNEKKTKKQHCYAGIVWEVLFHHNSNTVSVSDQPLLPTWEGLGHPQMGKNQMVLTFSGENNSIFDARKPYLTQWDLEKCNERDNKNSIKCNYDKNNVLYQERKIPRASTALGRAWGLRWVNIVFSLEKKNFILFHIHLFLALHLKGMARAWEGRAEGLEEFCKVRCGSFIC